MKNILSYFYGIIVPNVDNDGYFSYNNHLFCLYEYKRSLEEADSLYFLNNYMVERGIHVNKIILNMFNKVISFVNGKYYVLVLVNYRYSKNYFHFYQAPLNKNIDLLKRNNWAYLWSMKVDYIEYQIKHLEKTYPLLNNSVNYYIGLAENAISYFKMIVTNNESLYVNHRRINKNNLYNPLELVIDYKVRDIGEYLKKCFITKEKTIYDIKMFINNLHLNSIDYLLLYARMLYPSFYFDIYDNIVNNNTQEEEIVKIINIHNDYEELLFEVYQVIKRRISILGIDWINNKFI